jgi:hypothetical protein
MHVNKKIHGNISGGLILRNAYVHTLSIDVILNDVECTRL